MSLKNVLAQMLERIDGSVGAMFLDHEGEAVAVASRGLPTYDAQVVGAYEGIFLSQLRRICSALDHGVPQRFKIECAGASLLLADLSDGYYLVLVIGRNAHEGLAWQRLLETRDILLREI